MPSVVIAHGFKGFQGWGMFPWIAERLADAGFHPVPLDFSGNGVDERGEFSRLEKFRRNTLSREQADLAAVLDAIAAGRNPHGGRIRADRIGLLGHSRGGGGVILRAADDARVGAVATLAAIAHTDRFPPEMAERARREGYVEILNARTGQMLPVGREYFEDAPRHDIPGAAARMTQPLLLVHGTADESVPVSEARLLAAAAGPRATLLEIEGAGHTFGAVHPFAGPTPHLGQAVDAVIAFFRRTLLR
jgi:fermentation-respiration switch protein FrsA (DUF1100 family)